MTIGQRIAQRRKELGLSQEALGEQLGVSRQSIYKWESDTALPDIDKLVALSRLFSVTVGWLLGVEEDAAEAAPESGGQLTEAQLKMVEEIVSRYIAAQPAPTPPKRRQIFKLAVAAASLCLVLILFNLFQRLDQLDQRYSQVQSSVSSISSSVSGQINGISSRVEELLKAQNSLTADYGAEIKKANLETGSITFSVYAVPKVYVEGMSARFSVDNGNNSSIREVPEAIHQKFSADVTCQLTDAITISVVFTTPDGTRQTQLLASYYGLYSDTIPQVDVTDGGQLLYLEQEKDGAIKIPSMTVNLIQSFSSAAAVNEALGMAEIRDIRVGLFLNRKLVAWADADPPAGWKSDDPDSCRFLPATTVRMSPGDELCFAAVVTDVYGRDSIYSDIPYVLEDGELIYISGSDLSVHDPSLWTY